MDTKALLTQTKALHRARMVEIRADVDALKANSAFFNDECNDLIAQHTALGAVIAEKVAAINAIEQPRLHELKMELAEVARAEIAIKIPA